MQKRDGIRGLMWLWKFPCHPVSRRSEVGALLLMSETPTFPAGFLSLIGYTKH